MIYIYDTQIEEYRIYTVEDWLFSKLCVESCLYCVKKCSNFNIE